MTVSLYICLIFLVSNSQSSIIYNLVFFVLSKAHLHFIKCFPAAQYPTARSLAYNSITISPYLTHLRSSVSIHWCVCIIAYPRVALPSLLLSLAKCVLDSMLGEVCSLGGALLFVKLRQGSGKDGQGLVNKRPLMAPNGLKGLSTLA